MLGIWLSLEDEKTRYWVGSIVSLACVMMAYWASKLIRDNPRLRTVLALFACGWVLQMGAYGAPREAHALANLAADLVSFVHIFAGALLIEDTDSKWLALAVTALQAAGFWLLIALLVPHRQEFHDILKQAPIDAYKVEIVIALVLGLVSFLALGLGAWSSLRGNLSVAFFVLASALAVYSYLSIERAIELVSAPNPPPKLSSSMVLAFALAKLVLTATFSFIVVALSLKERDAVVAVPRSA